MQHAEPTVCHRRTAAPFLALAARHGLAVPDSTHGRVACEAFYELVAAVRHAEHDRSPGLAVSALIGPPLDPEIRAMITCAPSVGDAFASLARSSALYFDDVILEAVPEGRHLALRPIIKPERHDGGRELAIALLAGGLAYLARALGRAPAHRAVLGHHARAKGHLGATFARVERSAHEDVLLLPRDVLAFRPKSANDSLFRHFEREAVARSANRTWETSVSARVRALLLARPAPLTASITTTAEDLALCTRTLQRRLLAEGTSFERIQGAVLRQRALDGLAVTSAAEVGRMLGYADPSAFHRAVRGWAGVTPAALGASLRS